MTKGGEDVNKLELDGKRSAEGRQECVDEKSKPTPIATHVDLGARLLSGEKGIAPRALLKSAESACWALPLLSSMSKMG